MCQTGTCGRLIRNCPYWYCVCVCVCCVLCVSAPISAEPFASHCKSVTMKRPEIGPGGVQRSNPWECVHVCAAFLCVRVCVRTLIFTQPTREVEPSLFFFFFNCGCSSRSSRAEETVKYSQCWRLPRDSQCKIHFQLSPTASARVRACGRELHLLVPC